MRAAGLIAVLVAVVTRTAPPAAADGSSGTIEGTVTVNRDADAETVPVLVYVVGFTEAAPDATAEIQQRDKHFIPDLLAITAGQTVSFPNGDPFLHNVFSPTEAKRFDLGSYKKGDTRTRKFGRPGVIDVYCNIHPEMSATIVILPNRRFSFAAADGRFTIAGIPAGTWTVFAYSRRAAKPTSMKVTVSAGATASASLVLDENRADFVHTNKFGERYRGDGEYRPTR